MANDTDVHAEFSRRLDRVRKHGLGLSVDVYSPDLGELLQSLQGQGVLPAYLEVFRATSTALAAVRKQGGAGLFTYHGEGLWLTEPEAQEAPLFTQEIMEIARHLQILESAWMNHECATKQMAGYTFGTYLPPLYTESSAEIVAENARYVQDLLDRHGGLANGGSPLVLLELSPLTYFVTGTVAIPTFFRLVTQRVACGLVLDVGHLWTVYRYTGAWRTTRLTQFIDDFLSEFPLDRVVEIHVAGLAMHASTPAVGSPPAAPDGALPGWTDAHAAPIPALLYDMLDQILSHRRLTGLKGLALEVDTKPVDVIVEEFQRFSQRYAKVLLTSEAPPLASDAQGEPRAAPVSKTTRDAVRRDYERYARVVSGRAEPDGPQWSTGPACSDELDMYRTVYLPYEILHWGGEVEAMFPATCRQLTERAVPLSKFVSFWFREPRPLSRPYDFFLLKIDRFLEFAHEEAPELDELAGREANELRQAYESASEPAVLVHTK